MLLSESIYKNRNGSVLRAFNGETHRYQAGDKGLLAVLYEEGKPYQLIVFLGLIHASESIKEQMLVSFRPVDFDYADRIARATILTGQAICGPLGRCAAIPVFLSVHLLSNTHAQPSLRHR